MVSKPRVVPKKTPLVSLFNRKKDMKKLVSGILISAVLTTPAFAWGDREQGILAGAAGLLLLQHIDKSHRVEVSPTPSMPQPWNSSPVYVSPPVYATPQPRQYCESVSVVDQFGSNRIVQYCYVK